VGAERAAEGLGEDRNVAEAVGDGEVRRVLLLPRRRQVRADLAVGQGTVEPDQRSALRGDAGIEKPAGADLDGEVRRRRVHESDPCGLDEEVETVHRVPAQRFGRERLEDVERFDEGGAAGRGNVTISRPR